MRLELRNGVVKSVKIPVEEQRRGIEKCTSLEELLKFLRFLIRT